MSKRWMRMGAALAPAVLLAGLLSAAPLSASPAVGAGRLQPVVGPTNGELQRSDAVLSPRLSKLNTSSMKPRTQADQSEGVGLPASGAGSLLAGDQGFVVMITAND